MNEISAGILNRVDELRARLIRTSVLILILAVGAYFFRGRVMEIIRYPLDQDNLIFIHPTEAFFTYIKVSLFVGVVLGAPFILFQLIRFFSPQLKGKMGKPLLFLTFSSGTVFFYLGGGFALLIMMPFALKFLKGISGENLEAVFTVGNYASFVMTFSLVFGFIFEIPVLSYALARAGLLKKRTLISQWRYVLAGTVILAGILTPPDPITQMFLWGPLLFLYGLSILLAGLAELGRR